MRRRDPLSGQLDELAERNGASWAADHRLIGELYDAEERGDLPFLLDALTDPNVRRFAAHGIGKLRDPAATEPLLRLLDAGDWAVRGAAADGLGQLGDAVAIPRLIELAQHDPEPFPRAQGVQALRLIGGPGVAAALRPVLDDESLGVRRLAAATLADLGDPLGEQTARAFHRRVRFPIISTREPMRPLPRWMLTVLVATWVLAVVVAAGVSTGRTLLVVELAIALALDEIWLRLREREAYKRRLYRYDRAWRLGLGGWLFVVIFSGVLTVAAYLLYPDSAGLGVLLSLYLLFFRIGVERADRRREAAGRESQGRPPGQTRFPSRARRFRRPACGQRRSLWWRPDQEHETGTVQRRQRKRSQPIRAPASTRLAAKPEAAAAPGALLSRLQHAAGNAAVTGMVQRYESGEHAKQGDHAKGSRSLKVGTETLTSGEINALADLYGSPDDLIRAGKSKPAEVSAVVALIRKQAKGGGVAESEWDTATGGRYTQLNLKNSPHFGPRNAALVKPPAGAAAAGPDNLSTFLKYYEDTVAAIQQSHEQTDAAKRKELLDRSTLTAGFAEHFLMDAFSAGHLFNKDDFIASLKANLDVLPAAKLTGLFKSIASGVLDDKASAALLDQYKTIEWYGFHFSRPAVFQQLLEELYKDPEGRQAVYSGLVKVVHDDLSTHEAGSGLVGVEVENKFEKWVLSGDKTLDKSPDTQRIIDKALEQFRRIMQDYRTAPRSLASPTADASKVTDFFPHPTPASTKMISDLVTKVTDAGIGSIPALISVVRAELPAILDQLEARKKIRKS